MNHFVHRNIILPAFETALKGRKTLRYWAELERSQWLPAARLEELQVKKLRALMKHAAENCAFYAGEWRRLGIGPAAIESLADLAKFPLVTRETIRANRLAMRAHGMRLLSKATGGSSGEPLTFDLDVESHERRTAAAHRGYAWAGAAPGTRQLHLWGVPLGKRSIGAIVKDRLFHAMHRRTVVNCFGMDDAAADHFVRTLERTRPDAIVAYTSPIYDVARRLERAGKRAAYSPKSIVVGAEKLHRFQREVIERAFGAPVFETYGSREVMLIGAECERHDGLHVTSEHLIVELLDDDGQPVPPGAEGNVVVTDLHNYGMPFIRYVTGDRAIAASGACACGRGLPRLREVVGRRLDILFASGGRVIPGEFFPHLVKDYPDVRRFQVVQEEARRVRFLLQADAMPAAARASLEGQVREAFGPDVRVEFESPSQIPLTSVGKRQVVINRVSQGEAA